MSLLADRLPGALPLLATSLLAVAAPTPAAADSVEVDVSPALALDPDQVKAAIEAELGATVVDDPAAADLGSVTLRLDRAKRLAVSHRRPDGTLLVRVVKLPALPADRLAVIAFVTGNLVRDQLADLAAAAPAGPAPAPVPSADAPAVPDAASPVATTPPAPAVVTPPASITATAVVAPVEVPEVTVPLSIGIVPPLSTDRLFTSRARVRGALNVIVGASASVDGISISGAADLSANVRGLQIGGAATLSGDLRGSQLAGALAVARDMRGSQLAGAAAIARDTVGLQIAGAGTVARDLRGIQLAGAAALANDTVGLQIAGAGTVARDLRGIQMAGAAAFAREVTGLQIAGGTSVAGAVDGAQLASINVAGELRGLQLGAINVARRAHGLQLGAINIADDSDGAQIGALNFVRNGRTDIDAWAETTGLAALALRHGGRYVHNVYAIGFTPDGGDTPLLGLGIGTHHRVAGGTLDLDAMAWQTHLFQDGVGLLSQARATFAIDLGPVAGFIAAAYNVSVEDRGEQRPVRTVLARTIGEPMSSVDVALWPSLSAGVRGHLGARR